MTTSVVDLTTTWTLISTGACHVVKATLPLNKTAGIASPGIDRDQPKEIMVHIGDSAPAADTYAYKTWEEECAYSGSQKVYMRTQSGTMPIVIDTF